jgi:Fe-S-cluster-containing dehydrogenase component
MGPEYYVINPDRCTECVGHFDEPQCVQVCPVSCIPVDPARQETKDTLMAKYLRLQQQAAGAAPAPAGGASAPMDDGAAQEGSGTLPR